VRVSFTGAINTFYTINALIKEIILCTAISLYQNNIFFTLRLTGDRHTWSHLNMIEQHYLWVTCSLRLQTPDMRCANALIFYLTNATTIAYEIYDKLAQHLFQKVWKRTRTRISTTCKHVALAYKNNDINTRVILKHVLNKKFCIRNTYKSLHTTWFHFHWLSSMKAVFPYSCCQSQPWTFVNGSNLQRVATSGICT